MKNGDFRKRSNLINYLDDISRPPKKRIQISGRIIYFALLVLFGGYLLKLGYQAILTVQGEGQVLFKKLDIQIPVDVEICQVYRKEGEVVQVGDTLFTYYHERAIMANGSTLQSSRRITPNHEQINWFHREKIGTQDKIRLLEIERGELSEIIALQDSELQRIQQRVILHLSDPEILHSSRNRLKIRQKELQALDQEINYLESYLRDLHIPNPYRAAEIVDTDYVMEPPLQAYVTPVAGTITRIFKENYEVALESDVIMSIHNPENLYIKAFYDQRKLKHLREGDMVNVRFPDGTKSTGRLVRFYFATYRLPQEFQKQYEPLTRSIAADIVPLNADDLQRWKAFYKLNVNISKNRYDLL